MTALRWVPAQQSLSSELLMMALMLAPMWLTGSSACGSWWQICCRGPAGHTMWTHGRVLGCRPVQPGLRASWPALRVWLGGPVQLSIPEHGCITAGER